jgi:hypothetical protein
MAESGFVEAKNGFICVSCARAVSFARTRTAGKASRIPQLVQWQRSRQPLGVSIAILRECGSRSGKFFDYNAFFSITKAGALLSRGRLPRDCYRCSTR